VEATTVGDVSCGVFARLDGLDAETVHRFVVGEDSQPRPFDAGEMQAELGDPFATLVLLKGVFPRTAAGALEALAAAADNDLLAEQRSFVLGEGAQLADSSAGSGVERDVRFVVSTGTDSQGPEVIVSAFHPDSTDVELVAWDRAKGGFNYYRAVGSGPTWVFAGNSAHALSDPTQGKGPFESHPSGAILMKELKIPWNNWHSFEATMPASIFPAGDVRSTHPWFTKKQGAEVCEEAVAIPSMQRWAKARFDRIAESGQLSDPRRVMEHLLGTPTVNLVSSRATSRDPDAKGGVKIPPSFFANFDALNDVAIGLDPPPEFGVATDVYRASLEKFEFALRDSSGFEQKGDTKFAFFVPEPAAEDIAVLAEAMRIGLVSPRLAAALLMVDFANPIYSRRREKLLDHIPATATIVNGESSFSEEMANAILAAASSSPDASPEREFAARWEVGDDFRAAHNTLLASYVAAVTARIATQEGFDDYVRLADARRRRAKVATPIVREFELLFPQTNIEQREREMRLDGTVAELAS
jgi:hypothetical protein